MSLSEGACPPLVYLRYPVKAHIIEIDGGIISKFIFSIPLIQEGQFPESVQHKSIAGRYQPVRVADGPLKVRCRVIKNARWVVSYYLKYVHKYWLSA